MTKQIQLKSTEGLHATLAAKIVQLSGEYDASVSVRYEDITVDAKSVLGLLSLAIPSGENVTIIAEGTDAEEVLEVLKKIIEQE